MAAEQKIGSAGRKSEQKVAKRIGGRQTPASGAAGLKGDISLGNFMIECKSTTHDSISLQREWALKVIREALSAGKTPALHLTFTDDDGKTKPKGAWVCIPEWVFKELIDPDL
jgi:Holliday junction resolvase